MEKKFLSSLSLAALLLSSCARWINPAFTGSSNIDYLPRPIYNENKKSSRLYVSGTLNYSENGDASGKTNLAMLNIHRGHTFKHFNFAYGFFGAIGGIKYNDRGNFYKNDPPIESFSKNILGYGFRSTVGFQTISLNKETNFRLLNLEMAFSSEQGAFKDFRNSLYNGGKITKSRDVYVSNLSNIFTAGVSTEVIKNNFFHIKNFEASLRFFVGISPKLNDSYKNISESESHRVYSEEFIILSSMLKYNHLFSTVQMGGDRNFGAKFAIGYTF